MTIYYLMVKTHRITGLKYLCQTKQKNPYAYSGSGTFWKRHLTVHGKQIDTVILRECETREELKEWGLHYSNLYNVAESSEWANLMPETGDGSHRTPESIEKQISTRIINGTLNTNSLEKIAKDHATKMQRYGTLSQNTPESNTKREETKKRNGTGVYQKLTCQYCNKTLGKLQYVQWHGDRCKYKCPTKTVGY